MTKAIARDPMYRKRVFDADIIELCVRWYVTYRLSYRDLVEMMAERGVKVAHSTILRWVTGTSRSSRNGGADSPRPSAHLGEWTRRTSRSKPNGTTFIAPSTSTARPSTSCCAGTAVVRIYSIGTVDAHAKPMWHHKSVIAPFQIVLRLLTDLIALTALALRQRRATAAEILVLRRQIALYKERQIKPRRIDPATRISLALLSRFFNWRDT